MRAAFIAIFAVATTAASQRVPTETRTPKLLLAGSLDGVRDVKALSDGRFFALTDAQVHAYDARGALIRRFERKTKVSTSILANPVSLVLTDSTLTILDAGTRRLNTFRLDGTYLGAQVMPGAAELQVSRKMRGGVTLVESTPPVPVALDSFATGFSLERTVSAVAGSSSRELFRIRLDTVYFRGSRDSVFGLPNQTRSMRNAAQLLHPVPTRFGAGGAWTSSGDSLIAHVDGASGVVKWYAVDERGARVIDSARLARPVRRVTPADIEDEAARLQRLSTSRAPRGRAPPANVTRPELFGAPSVWSAATKMFFASDGALWVGVNRLYFDAADGNRLRIGDDNTWTVYPRTGSAYLVTLRPLFRLTDAAGGRVYGYVDDGVTTPVIEVYSLR
jgi:hypothetical protein